MASATVERVEGRRRKRIEKEKDEGKKKKEGEGRGEEVRRIEGNPLPSIRKTGNGSNAVSCKPRILSLSFSLCSLRRRSMTGRGILVDQPSLASK